MQLYTVFMRHRACPWGPVKYNPDLPADNTAGVFYISQADFDKVFKWQYVP